MNTETTISPRKYFPDHELFICDSQGNILTEVEHKDWRFSGFLNVGDVNGDGVKEIVICGNTEEITVNYSSETEEKTITFIFGKNLVYVFHLMGLYFKVGH